MTPASDNRFDSSRVCTRCDGLMRVKPINKSGKVVQWGKGSRVIWLCSRCYASAEVTHELEDEVF